MWPTLLLVGIPVAVHFFARARPRKIPFSSVRFIAAALRRTARIQRPRSLLLMLLRSLLFAALALALMHPTLLQPGAPSAAASNREVWLFIDRSASMGALEGAGSRFSRAVARADEILSGLGTADTANIVWARTPPVAEFPAPGVNHALLRNALHEARPSSERGSWSAALGLAQSAGQRGRKAEFYFLSDFQESDWRDVSPPPGMENRAMIRTGEARVGNRALTRLLLPDPPPVVGEKATVLAEVINHSDIPALTTVFLRAGSFAATAELRLPAGSSGTAPFTLSIKEPGDVTVEATLNEDAFPMDNVRHGILRVAEHLRVALLAGDGAGSPSAAWRAATEAVEWMRIVDDPGAADVVLVPAWSGADAAQLRTLATSGATVMVCPSGGVPEGAVAELFRGQSGGGSQWIAEETSQGFRLERGVEAHPVFEVFAEGEFGDPTGGRVERRVRVPKEMFSPGTVLLAYEDGLPAVAEIPIGKGRVVLWTICARAGGRGEWMERAEFVPLFAELLAKRPVREGATTVEQSAGVRLMRPAPHGALPGDLSLRLGQTQVQTEFLPGERPVFISPPITAVGVYEWIYRGMPVGGEAVNFPTTESDLAPGDPPAWSRGEEAVVIDSGLSMKELREGRPLWPLLAGLAVVLACIEIAVAYKTRPKA